MLDISERKRGKCGNETKPSQMVTWLRCQICGELLPPISWDELLYKKRDLCKKHKNVKIPYKCKDEIMTCVKKRRAYLHPTAVPPKCREMGATDCTKDCPYPDCIIDNDSLNL